MPLVSLLTVGATVSLYPKQTLAQVNVNSVIQSFSGTDRPVKNVIATNSGTVPIYVSISVEKVRDLSASEVAYEASPDLLVSPKNFSIGPKGDRTVRILLKNRPAEKEVAYRVLFIPQQEEFGAEQTQTINRNGKTMVLHVATGVGMLVYAEPMAVTKKFSTERTHSGVTFTNNGNIQGHLSGGVACPTSVTLTDKERAIAADREENKPLEAKGCVSFTGKRLHPGQSHSIVVAPKMRLYLKQRFGSQGSFEPLVIDPPDGGKE